MRAVNDASSKDLLKDPSAMPMSRKIILGLLFALPVVAVIIYGVSVGSKRGTTGLKVVDWGMYSQYDPATSAMPPDLQVLDGQKIRSPGFMVPLEDNRAEVTEFLLVPNPQACIHAPPPPSNQMVYVRMVAGPAKTLFGPVMVEGTLRVTSQTHQYGTASFQIYGEFVESYRPD
jgi:hypothetical protein